jgi:hypothetical protein
MNSNLLTAFQEGRVKVHKVYPELVYSRLLYVTAALVL